MNFQWFFFFLVGWTQANWARWAAKWGCCCGCSNCCTTADQWTSKNSTKRKRWSQCQERAGQPTKRKVIGFFHTSPFGKKISGIRIRETYYPQTDDSDLSGCRSSSTGSSSGRTQSRIARTSFWNSRISRNTRGSRCTTRASGFWFGKWISPATLSWSTQRIAETPSWNSSRRKTVSDNSINFMYVM